MVERCGTLIATDFGSAATEAALCQRSVGIADRSDLVKLELSDRPDRLLALIEGYAGAAAQPPEASARWLLIEADRALVLCDPCQASRVLRVLEIACQRGPTTIRDRSGELAALAVVGPRAPQLLAAVSELTEEQLATAESFVDLPVAGEPVLLLRAGRSHYLAVLPAERAAPFWRSLDAAGRALGVGWVGHEAIEHLAINASTAARQRR